MGINTSKLRTAAHKICVQLSSKEFRTKFHPPWNIIFVPFYLSAWEVLSVFLSKCLSGAQPIYPGPLLDDEQVSTPWSSALVIVRDCRTSEAPLIGSFFAASVVGPGPDLWPFSLGLLAAVCLAPVIPVEAMPGRQPAARRGCRAPWRPSAPQPPGGSPAPPAPSASGPQSWGPGRAEPKEGPLKCDYATNEKKTIQRKNTADGFVEPGFSMTQVNKTQS